MIQNVHIFSFTLKQFSAEQLGVLYIAPEKQASTLTTLKQEFQWSELMYIGTCNRVEFIFVQDHTPTEQTLHQLLLRFLNPKHEVELYLEKAQIYEGYDAVRHLFRVASSLDSMVIGEREIITQVRQSFTACDEAGLCGDTIRLMINKTIEAGKAIYTNTNIAKNPVSVVSLAYHKLTSTKSISKDSKILMVGAGQTNTAFARNLKKHGYTNLHIFNRTFSKAQALAEEVDAQAYDWSELNTYRGGFDVLITCTGSATPVITPDLFERNPSSQKRPVFDLALPYDIDRGLAKNYNLSIVGIETLKQMAEQNLNMRAQELDHCEQILDEKMTEFKLASKQRKLEIAMRAVPTEVKNIKKTALNEVFAQDIQGLDENSKEVLDKILNYMEKKYIRVPMKMARDIILETEI